MKIKVFILLCVIHCIVYSGCSKNNVSTLILENNNSYINFDNFEPSTGKIAGYNDIKRDKKLVFLIYQNDRQIDPMIEVKLNALLFSKGRDYNVDIIGLSTDELELSTVQKAEIMLNQNEQIDILCCGGMEVCDLNPYDYCIEKNYFMELDDFLYSDKGNKLINVFSEMVWDRVRSDNGKIYGINNCSALGDTVGFAYDSELYYYYEFSFENFWKNTATVESIFKNMLKDEVTPICLERYDILLANYMGMDVYDGIFTLQNQNNIISAYNFLEDPNIVMQYKKLGELRAKGFLTYSEFIKEQYANDIKFKLNKPSDLFLYKFSILNNNISVTSDKIVINSNKNDIPLLVDLYIPKINNYTYINDYRMQTGVMNSSNYIDESIDFLQLIYTDKEIGMLLSYGIEGRQYLINNNKLICNTSTEILESTKVFPVDTTRYFPVQTMREKYQTERQYMNSNILYGALYGHVVDFGNLKSQYEECSRLFDEYSLVFIGYYEDKTEEKLLELNNKLKSAGYDLLLDSLNKYIKNELK